ncbi:MAG: hypothetical protein KA521_08645 [Crocinitomicaceae bacterium]|nr:hypothetical protein [Crocinitomicaceae bacterium]
MMKQEIHIILKKSITVYNNRINPYTLIGILILFCCSKLNAQKDIRIGFKIHPNLSFSNVIDKSDFDENLFSIQNGLIGLNFGSSVNFQKNKWLFEISSGINSNRMGLKFNKNSDFAQLNVRTLSFTNELNFGLRLFISKKPYFEVFYMVSYSYSLVGIQKLSGNSKFENVISYEEIYPNLDLTWQSNNIGTGIKIRTQLKNGRKFDYGISYRIGSLKNPQIGMKIQYQTQTFHTTIQPKVSTLNIDFIYYLGKRLKS